MGVIHYRWRVYGKPKAQPRPRAYRKGKRAAVYDPGTASAWKESVKRTLANEGYPQEPLTGPVTLTLLFRLPRPVKHYSGSEALKPSAPLDHLQKPDFDNLAKAVVDAMTDIGVWTDDCLVIHCEVHKRWSDEIDAGVEISLRAPY